MQVNIQVKNRVTNPKMFQYTNEHIPIQQSKQIPIQQYQSNNTNPLINLQSV